MPRRYRPEGGLNACRAARKTCRERVYEEQMTKHRAGRAACMVTAETHLPSEENAGEIICRIKKPSKVPQHGGMPNLRSRMTSLELLLGASSGPKGSVHTQGCCQCLHRALWP